MERRLLFLYNPFAGKGKIKTSLSDILQIFAESGFEITVHPTMESQDLTQTIKKEAQRFDYIVVSGGDGTLHELADGLMALPPEQRPPCGYIPTGTVNDFATSLEIPKQVLKAAKLAAVGQPAFCDIGEMNGHFFTYIAGFGAFTEVAYETSQATKNALGKMAYFLDGAKRIASLKRYPLTLAADGVTAFEGEVLFGMITNSYSVGGFRKMMNEQIELDDGIFEIRTKFGSDITRVLYFFVIGKRVILTNGFIKKTQKTPASEITLAKQYRIEYLTRKENSK